jgi:hypothetical protein
MSILAHPPDKFDLVISVLEQSASLDFSIGLDPSISRPDRGDGVVFSVRVIDGNNRTTVFTKYIDPKNDPCDKKWFDESVPLDRWAGKEITLQFVTDAGPAGNMYWDWAYWGDIRLGDGKKTQASGTMAEDSRQDLNYKTVHQDPNVEIFQNQNVYPRAFMVYEIINATSLNQAMDVLANPDLDLRQTAVVENFPNDSKTAIDNTHQKAPSGTADVKRITPDAFTAEVQTNSPGLLVISEQYYPGWYAYVEGKETPIYAVDGILRGIFLNEGKHMVRLEYKPLSFSIGLAISILSLLATIARLVYLYRQSLSTK